MVEKTSIKIEKDLNRQLSIFSLLENKKKEDLTNEIITNGLKEYQEKYKKYKFKQGGKRMKSMFDEHKLMLEALAVLLTPKRYGSKAKERIAKDIDRYLK